MNKARDYISGRLRGGGGCVYPVYSSSDEVLAAVRAEPDVVRQRPRRRRGQHAPQRARRRDGHVRRRPLGADRALERRRRRVHEEPRRAAARARGAERRRPALVRDALRADERDDRRVAPRRPVWKSNSGAPPCVDFHTGGDSSTQAAARAAIDASVTRRAQKKFCRALGPASPASKKGAAVVETNRS